MTKIYNSKFGSAQVFEDTGTGHLRLVDPDTGLIVSDVGVDRSFIVGDPIAYEYGDEGDLGLLREEPVEEDDVDISDGIAELIKKQCGIDISDLYSADADIDFDVTISVSRPGSKEKNNVYVTFYNDANGFYSCGKRYAPLFENGYLFFQRMPEKIGNKRRRGINKLAINKGNRHPSMQITTRNDIHRAVSKALNGSAELYRKFEYVSFSDAGVVPAIKIFQKEQEETDA